MKLILSKILKQANSNPIKEKQDWMPKYAGYGGAINLLKTVGKYLTKSPKYLINTGKIGLGVGATSALGEMGLRTGNNLLHGNPQLGTPTWTAKQLGSLANTVSNVLGISPTISSVATSTINGMDNSPKVQNLLQTGANITNPNVRNMLANDATQAIGDAGNAAVQNIGKTLGRSIGGNIADETANNIWSHLAKNPIPTLTGAAIVGAGPAIAYDAITHNRRKEEVERNKAIMRYIIRRENEDNISKTASVMNEIGNIIKSPIFKRLIY